MTTTTHRTTTNRYLQDTFAPVRDELTATDLSITGHLPDYLEGRSLDDINARAFAGTRAAHREGGVPTIGMELATLDERSVGGLLFFFEKAVAVSGRLLVVNPFDQPGVEAYKREMFRMLGKPV